MSGSEEEPAGINGASLSLNCGDLSLLLGEAVAKQNAAADGVDLWKKEDWFKLEGGASRSNKLKYKGKRRS